MQDGQFNSTVTNPYVGALLGQVGLSSCASSHDYSWLVEETSAAFNTSLNQTFRSPRIRAVSMAVIRFQTTEETVFHLESLMAYSHTPGDAELIDWNVRLRNQTASLTYFDTDFDGGNGHNEPSSGSFTANETHILPANSLFQFSYTLDSSSLADTLPTGIMDINGHVNWTLTPEPTTLLLIANILPFLRRPCRT